MRTFIFLPPLPRMSGGLAVLQTLGAQLHAAGRDVFFVARERSAWLSELERPGFPPLVMWESGDGPKILPPLCPSDIWLIPEGWPHALLPGLRAGARVVMYVQNWAYLLSEWPAGLEPAKLPVHYLAVSRPVAWHIREVTGRHAELLRPGIDITFFHPHSKTDNPEQRLQEDPSRAPVVGPVIGPVIGWMPRKNKALARQIREIVTARRTQQKLVQPEWVEIADMTQSQVAETLQLCDIFLATGFPEGCPLPPLEAMASGCIGVGFAGFGGWDYMRESPEFSEMPSDVGRIPLWLPESVRTEADPRPANGFWASDGDVIGAVLALEKAMDLTPLTAQGSHLRHTMAQGARQTAELYSLEAQKKRVLELWQRASDNILFVGAEV